MDLKLHANATTTPRTRAYIQQSPATNAALARELGVQRPHTSLPRRRCCVPSG